MKKFFVLMLILSLCTLSGCGSLVSILPNAAPLATAEPVEEVLVPPTDSTFVTAPVFDFLALKDFGESFYTDTPIALSLQYNTADGEGCISPVFDRTSIISACEALRSMSVTGEADSSSAVEQERIYVLTMSDGTEYSFTFDDWNLVVDGVSYTVSGGDALWSISFPAYNTDFDVFDLYFSEDVRTFADSFYTDMPVSVGSRSNSGATLTSEDPTVITAVFEALSGASVNLVENRADQNIDVTQVRDIIFTASDGTAYTFSFAQQCLAVQCNADYGTVYYWLGNAGSLWTIDILPDTEETVFAGGELTGLREDIQRAAEVADGLQEDLSVIGVYVSYSISGQEGYLTLQDQTATDFTAQISRITATSETVDVPEGDTITVSVTLSDGSGPIFYFTGDSVQEVIGTYYRCDATDMANLRSTILDLAAQGNNDAEVMD